MIFLPDLVIGAPVALIDGTTDAVDQRPRKGRAGGCCGALLSAGGEFCCPSAGSLLSAYMEYELSVVNAARCHTTRGTRGRPGGSVWRWTSFFASTSNGHATGRSTRNCRRSLLGITYWSPHSRCPRARSSGGPRAFWSSLARRLSSTASAQGLALWPGGSPEPGRRKGVGRPRMTQPFSGSDG